MKAGSSLTPAGGHQHHAKGANQGAEPRRHGPTSPCTHDAQREGSRGRQGEPKQRHCGPTLLYARWLVCGTLGSGPWERRSFARPKQQGVLPDLATWPPWACPATGTRAPAARCPCRAPRATAAGSAALQAPSVHIRHHAPPHQGARLDKQPSLQDHLMSTGPGETCHASPLLPLSALTKRCVSAAWVRGWPRTRHDAADGPNVHRRGVAGGAVKQLGRAVPARKHLRQPRRGRDSPGEEVAGGRGESCTSAQTPARRQPSRGGGSQGEEVAGGGGVARYQHAASRRTVRQLLRERRVARVGEPLLWRAVAPSGTHALPGGPWMTGALLCFPRCCPPGSPTHSPPHLGGVGPGGVALRRADEARQAKVRQLDVAVRVNQKVVGLRAKAAHARCHSRARLT